MKKTQGVLVDDIDGGAADDTIVFAFKGVSYEIDLSEAHIEEMTADFAKWAKAEGVAVNERGRISADVVAAYEAAKA